MTNVAVVVLDTLRKDAFDEAFDWLPGTRFEQAWSVANYTIPAHGSLFTGRYPSETGVHAKAEDFDAPDQALPELLADAGYTTRAFSANPLVTRLRGFDRGFEQFEAGWHVKSADPDLFNWSAALGDAPVDKPWSYPIALARCLVDRASPTLASLRAGWQMYRADDDGAREAIRWARRTSFGDREFAFLNLMEAHAPYWPPQAYRSVEVPARSFGDQAETPQAGGFDHGPERQAYDDCVRYLSDRYAELFDALRDDFDVIVTCSDHGELFGEHGGTRHFHGLYEELTHVPLSVWTGGDGVDDRDAVVSLLDVFRTVCDATGVDAPDAARGRSLLADDLDGRPILTEYHGLRPHRLEMIRGWGFDDATIEPYDRRLTGVAAPPDYYGHETADGEFLECGTCGAGDPRAVLDDLEAELDVRTVDPDPDDLADKTMRHLEHLGYA